MTTPVDSAPQAISAAKVAKRKIVRDMSLCILCGRCANVCPASAIKFTREAKGVCTHCNLCAEICPVKAIDSFEWKPEPEVTVPHYAKLKSYKDRVIKFNCVMCMECYERCPSKAIYLDNGHLFIKKGDAKASIINCSLCTLCVTSCPTNALRFELGKVVLNPDFCVLCGECSRVCPPATMRLKDRYPEGACVMCGRCVKSCPVKALSIKQVSWDGAINDSCVRCGTCSKVCPTGAIEFSPITQSKPAVDISKCILCEICASDCPTNAIPIKVNLPQRRLMSHSITVNRDQCIGCSLCVDACKIALRGDHAPELKDGLAYINTSKCIGCGACATTCPTDCIRLVKVYSTKHVAGKADEVVILP
ncbi:MAG: 4Fe-4S binding protein [Candidatus Methanomethylicus sp.]|nr:4Fe-4S binding protein [Candidatus Methanomethylicus sp.]